MQNALAEKLRLDPQKELVVINRPDRRYFSVFQVLEGYPESPADAIVLFADNLQTLQEMTGRIIRENVLNAGGRLLIAYPKKGNRTLGTYLHRDEILPSLDVDEDGYIRGSDFRFNQMVSLDGTYTLIGIKRGEKRRGKKSPSQRVGDYIQYIPQIEEDLKGEPKALDFFRGLTPGYQRGWARYVYGAVRPETREKRIKEMARQLKEGVKSPA